MSLKIIMIRSDVGICDMAFYVPKLYLNIENLAIERNLEYNKLNKGLGLESMRIPDKHEDAATMAANAVDELMEKNQLKPQEIGRIYLGTESALDGAKPTATYVLEMLRRKFKSKYGPNCFNNCDVVDLTFACIGAIDALQNTLDWVRGNKNRKGIVVASDFAKYELNSGGEYTQGAGAIAMLIQHNPKLIVIDDIIGVATQGVHDFFKPRRTHSKKELLNEMFDLAKINNKSVDDVLKNIPDTLEVNGILDSNEETIQIYKETPIFDGQYSNWTYQNRIKEAYLNYYDKRQEQTDHSVEMDYFDSWDRLIFHLPYAFHGKRIASELFMISMKKRGLWTNFSSKVMEEPIRENFEDDTLYESTRVKFLRSITKTEEYTTFVNEKLEKAQRASTLTGNMYACSIFLALMSTLESDLNEGVDLTNAKFGFFGYGSGSKSKVFEGRLQDTWKNVVSNFNVFQKLEEGLEIDYNQYERIHRKQITESIQKPSEEFIIEKIGTEGVRLGARYYKWQS